MTYLCYLPHHLWRKEILLSRDILTPHNSRKMLLLEMLGRVVIGPMTTETGTAR